MNETPQQKPNPILLTILVMAVVALFGILGWFIFIDGFETGSGVAGTPETIEADPGAELACPHFRNVMADVNAGLYTDAELRTRLQEVHDDAEGSEVPGIAANAEQMVRGITQGDDKTLTAGVAEFSSACESVGL